MEESSNKGPVISDRICSKIWVLSTFEKKKKRMLKIPGKSEKDLLEVPNDWMILYDSFMNEKDPDIAFEKKANILVIQNMIDKLLQHYPQTKSACVNGPRDENGKCPKRKCAYGERLSNGRCPKKEKKPKEKKLKEKKSKEKKPKEKKTPEKPKRKKVKFYTSIEGKPSPEF